MDFNKLRSYFPVTDSFVYFNNAGEAPMNLLFRKALNEFYDLACNAPQTKPDVRQDVRQSLSELLGGHALDYALITSTGVGCGIVSSGMTFESGDNIVIPENEHRNNIFPWLILKKKGVDIRFVPVASDGYIDIKDFEAAIDDRTRVVTLAAVRFNSGFRIDLKKVSDITHKHNALLFVDAIQAAGVVPINVDEMGIDMMSSSGFKWLMGIAGTGYLYMNAAARDQVTPVMPGKYAIDSSINELTYYPDSRKYETGSIAYSLFYAWLKGLEIIKETGIDTIYERVLQLTDILIDGFKKRKIHIVTPIKIKSERSAIVFCDLGSTTLNEKLRSTLEENNIIIAVRDGKCRISPSFYNTAEEIKKFFDVLDTVI